MPGREAPLPFRNHLPPPSHGHRSPPPDGRPRTPRLPCPRLPEEPPQHEKAWAKKLAVLIRTRRGRQGFSRIELDHGGGGPGRGVVGVRDAVDGADHQLLSVRAGKAPDRQPVPLPGEGRAAEEDAGPAAAELRVRRPLAHRDPDRRTRMTWASASPPGRMPSSESPRAPAAHAAAARYAADASKRG